MPFERDDEAPKTHQDLFLWAIKQRCSVIGEFYWRAESWELRKWAITYAKAHGLTLPVSEYADIKSMQKLQGLDTFGIYHLPDAEEFEELRNAGLIEKDFKPTD